MKKVLCIIDVYNWAMHNRVLAFKKYLKSDYTFDIKLTSEINKNILNQYDIVYNLNWVLHKHIKNHLDYKKNRKYRLVTTVCSHGGRKASSDLKVVFDYYDNITASSVLLYKELKPLYSNKLSYTPFGVDDSVFKLKRQPAPYHKVAGFVGKTNRPLKRYTDIQDAARLSRVSLKTVSHNSKFNQAQMSNFYNTVGMVICFSQNEGTPNPVLEGAACGRAIISTPVGNVPELFGSKYPLKPVTNRRELIAQLTKLNRNPELISDCSRYLSKEIKDKWTWQHKVKGFKGVFK